MRRFLLNLVLGLAFLAGAVRAQETPTLSNLELSLWPEFDRPEMLVIYRGLFAPDTPLPVAVEFRIPARAGQPTAVAYVGEGGQRLNLLSTTRAEGDWLVVSFELPTLGFQLEYYDALAVDPAGQREFAYTYTADYPVTELSVDVQVPPDAQAFALDPAADTVIQQDDGLTYHLVKAGSLLQGETRSWTVTYQKAGSALTAESLGLAETPAEAAPPATEDGDQSNVAIFIIAFVALVAVGGGAFWLGRQTQPAPEPTPSPPRQSKRRGSGGSRKGIGPESPQPSPSFGEEAAFCYQCGAEMRPDSEFCHKCGAAVRRS
jgi:hypothetical protein